MAKLTGGDKLLARLAEMAVKVRNPGTLEVGFLENASYSDGTPVAAVAAFNEYGVSSRGQPPRPFMRPTVAAGETHWGRDLAALLKEGNMDAATALEQMGAQIAGEIRKAIKDLKSPPLAPSTVAAKGFDKPLVDSGHMLNSVDHRVRT